METGGSWELTGQLVLLDRWAPDPAKNLLKKWHGEWHGNTVDIDLHVHIHICMCAHIHEHMHTDSLQYNHHIIDLFIYLALGKIPAEYCVDKGLFEVSNSWTIMFHKSKVTIKGRKVFRIRKSISNSQRSMNFLKIMLPNMKGRELFSIIFGNWLVLYNKVFRKLF